MNINYESDFTLLEQNNNGDSSIPFIFVYKTDNSTPYVASFDGATYYHCKRIDDNNLLVIFDNHGLNRGILMVHREYRIPNQDFYDGILNLTSYENTGIYLTNGKSDASTATIEVFPSYIKGDKGDPLMWGDLTQEQKDELSLQAKEYAVYNYISSVYTSILPTINYPIKKLIDGGEAFAPTTRSDAVIDLNTGKSAQRLFSEKADKATKVNGQRLDSDILIDKVSIGLPNVDNTSDLHKPISIATQDAINLIQARIDTLISGSASTAIDTFNEIQAFLNNISDTSTLQAIIDGLNESIADSLSDAKAYADTNDNYLLGLVNGKVDKSSVVQSLGTSTTNVMSQNAVNDAILSSITTVPLVVRADGTIAQYKVVTPSGVQGSSDTPYFKLYSSTSGYMPSGISSASLADKEVSYQKCVKMGLIRNISTIAGSMAENWNNGQIIYVQSDGSLGTTITEWIGGAFFKDIDANKGSLYVRIEYNHNFKVDKTSLSGTFANKPILPEIGVAYFCTDKQATEGLADGITIYHKGSNVWVDALGRTIS